MEPLDDNPPTLTFSFSGIPPSCHSDPSSGLLGNESCLAGDSLHSPFAGPSPLPEIFVRPDGTCFFVPVRRNKIVSLTELLAVREGHRQCHRSVVWTNGCFDLIHAGHVRSLQAARQFGDVLVVGLNSDESVRRLKGEGRPILPQAERAELLAALECVDHVLIFDDLLPTPILEQLRPDVHAKGADYLPPHGKPIPERAVVEAYGGRVAFLALLPGLSTTALIRRAAAAAGSV